ncbi:hypothetical protein [Kribbella endophytica]
MLSGLLVATPAHAAEADAATQQACAMARLPIPTGYHSTKVTGMSDDGSVIAYRAVSRGPDGPKPKQLLYSGGKVTEVPMLRDYGTLRDVNAAGVGVGGTFISPKYVPYVWRDGKMSELPTPEGGEAFAINAKGDIVGSRDRGDTTVPVVWRAGGNGPVDLALPTGMARGIATQISKDGTIVGEVMAERDNSGKPKPYMWRPDGTRAYLAMPKGVVRADASVGVTDIKGNWASGWLSAPSVGYGGVRWNIANGTANVVPLGDWVAVSANGVVASHRRDSPIAAYRSGTTIVDLPGLIDPADNTFRDNVVAISANASLLAGDVFIGEYDADEQPYTNAVTWTCG